MADYRPVPDERLDEHERMTGYAFNASAGPQDPDEEPPEGIRRYFSFSEARGLFDGEELLVTCGHVPFSTRLRGEWLPTAGLTLVASPPEHRRQGYVGELLAGRAAGVPRPGVAAGSVASVRRGVLRPLRVGDRVPALPGDRRDGGARGRRRRRVRRGVVPPGPT